MGDATASRILTSLDEQIAALKLEEVGPSDKSLGPSATAAATGGSEPADLTAWTNPEGGTAAAADVI